MNTTTALKTSATYGGPAVFATGAAMLTAALVGAGQGGVTAAPRPAPTVTVTQTPAPISAPSPGATAAKPRQSPTPVSASTVVTVSDHVAAAVPHTSDGALSHAQARPPSASSSSPSPPAAPCGGHVLTVRVLARACLSVGR